ncbi:hypothetical protein LMH77_09725 [Vibrio lentus]|uniref:hypothetical protein n=1 Tax=Vibrio lentus TaxID=136468 RepID=UPI000C826DC7|nr:hypothetical protein [Vibrio lentus]MCC4783178.1 hypothetical protein [Vibrio lentus]PMJ04275.1 hypothetical protein BCU31_13820 [Vibrio lentus]TKG22271.1 hypothetical protein FCW05_01225 [Vibrio lentus]
MRFLTILTIVLSLSIAGTYVIYLPKNEFVGLLWQSDEVILNENLGISTEGNFMKLHLTLLFLANGKFTASTNAKVYDNSGFKESVTQEFFGSWIKQGRFVHMRKDEEFTVMGPPDQQSTLDRVAYYTQIGFNQTYSVNYYDGRLVLVATHAGGPMVVLHKNSYKKN